MARTLTDEIISAAIEGYEVQKSRIDGQITELRAMLPGSSNESKPARKGRRFSAAARQRMKEAQQRRWAKVRGESAPAAVPEPSKPKRRLSKAGRAAIVAALKKRWATKRAEAGKSASTGRRSAGKKAPAKRASAKPMQGRAAKKEKSAAAASQPATPAV